MGILRLYLAACVVAAHTQPLVPWSMIRGDAAVQVFYVVSGFYMQLISGKYATNILFYKSRFWRIFPAYYLACALTVTLTLVGLPNGGWINNEIRHPLQSMVGFFGAVVNLTIIGQDAAMFLQPASDGTLIPTADYREFEPAMWRRMVVPQAWSVAVELLFYAAVPFLCRLRSRWLITLVACSLSLRIGVYECLQLRHDPWTYRFFPFEVALFVCGMLACRHSGPLTNRMAAKWLRNHRAIASLAVIVAAVLTAKISNSDACFRNYGPLIAACGCAVAIPTLFAVFGSSRADRAIGELSYPVYLFHYVLIPYGAAAARVFVPVGLNVGHCTFALAIVVSLIAIAIIYPIEKYRARFSHL